MALCRKPRARNCPRIFLSRSVGFFSLLYLVLQQPAIRFDAAHVRSVHFTNLISALTPLLSALQVIYGTAISSNT